DAELVGADRLDHLDRDDLAEVALDGSVVLLEDLDRQPARPLTGEHRLLVRDRDPGDAAAVVLRRVTSEAAPPAPDLEHMVAGAELEQAAQTVVLRPLRVRERHRRTLEDGAGVRHRLVEHQREELVAEVVVVGDVAARAGEAAPAVEPRTQLEQAPHARMALGGRVGVPEQELDEPDEVVRIPFVRGVRLAQPELAARREAAEEHRVVDREAHRSARAEAARTTAGELDLEGAAFERGERALEHRCRSALEQAAAGSDGLDANAHVRTLPWPGTNGGLWWNGTRLSQSRSAWKWMSAITCSGWSGYRSRSPASERFVSSRRRPCRMAVSGRAPSSSRTWMRAHTSSPGCENAYS